MSRKYEDFDEFCDPDNPRQLKLEEVLEAVDKIREDIVYTPCMPSHFQREMAIPLYYKMEILQRTGCFKERGVVNVLNKLPLDKRKLGVVIASLGNAAVAVAYHAHKMSVPVIVVLPNNVPISKLQKCHTLGAKVFVQGGNLVESQRYARGIARDKGLTYINCRDHPDLLAGYGTLALEILEQIPYVDAILLPVGCGGLAAAVATVIKNIKPSCLVYGVQTEAMPVFFKSLENGEPVMVPTEPTLADGVAVSNVGVNSFFTAQSLVDKVLLVHEDWIARAMLHLIEKERLVMEPAGACPLAAILGNLVPELKLKNVVIVLTGGAPDVAILPRIMERGLAAEGRLVKFRVGVKDNTKAITQLMKLICDGGYNLVQQFQDHRWLEDDVYRVEIRLVIEAKDLEHALELKRIIERAYPNMSVFETAPFNDKRTCPCYVRKSMNGI